MSRPLIGISAFAHLLEDRFPVHISGVRNSQAVAEVTGGMPLIVPGEPGAYGTAELVELLDGLLLTGARPNVHPSHYGEEETEGHGPFDRGRDDLFIPLTRAMVAAGKPVFGVCRGIQEMNVAFGGTLYPEVSGLEGRLNHRMPKDEMDVDVIFRRRHPVRFREGGAFHRLLGLTETVTNSLHGQAVREPGPRVVVEGWAEDDTIEAISIEGATSFALGVQWHAEYEPATDPVSRALFTAFGDAARRARAARSAVGA
ncbi:MAG TPA: gamma-glutamyl-gamma-aminobutyrate hydrolase family protein [Thermohalobaculum sp.]|nr:gamma-glutamyl-gamma-aminobutyrate hydrolase family protein [Thermohalobaculum sp.]